MKKIFPFRYKTGCRTSAAKACPSGRQTGSTIGSKSTEHIRCHTAAWRQSGLAAKHQTGKYLLVDDVSTEGRGHIYRSTQKSTSVIFVREKIKLPQISDTDTQT